jgi:hypothetical protein
MKVFEPLSLGTGLIVILGEQGPDLNSLNP